MPFTVRPATLDDAPAICELLNKVDELEIGRPETDLHEVEADLKQVEADLPRDSWLAHDAGGGLVAYGLLWDDSGAERIDVDHYVLPDQQAAGARLFELMEARAVEKAVANGAERAVVHLHLNSSPTLDLTLLEARGWRRVRRYQVMTREVSEAADPFPPPFPGLALRTCEAEADRRLAHRLVEATMADHFDHQPRTYGQWLQDLDAERLDWSLIWIATLDGRDVGLLLSRDDRQAMAWIRTIGVLPEARGQGIAGHLLRHAFATYASRGRSTVGLGVDVQNATGALRLYEAHGMRQHYAVDTWELISPSGV
ncbi:GNAT family N-acetyltransferase [Streptomyces sp. T-3]|nr:GNAT family N-acetyltransferase [Streptomyces sp. T-3]